MMSSHAFEFLQSTHRLAMSQCRTRSINWRFSMPALNTPGTQTKTLSILDIACPRESLIWVVSSSAAVHRLARGVALTSAFLCQQNFLAAMLLNFLMLQSGCENLLGTALCYAAHSLWWPEAQVVVCEVESCVRWVQSTVTGFPHQHPHSLFSQPCCYYEVSTNATCCSSTGKQTPEVVLANKQHWNRHLDVLIEALQ